jgi:RHS repeat-associated protein
VPSAAAPWVEGNALVNVTNGRLTLRAGARAQQARLAFLTIESAAPPRDPGLLRNTSDFDRDGVPDLVWRYDGPGGNQGVNLIWYMRETDGAIIREWKALPAESDLNWRLEATDDFDRDGIPDILWRYYGPDKTENDPTGAPVTLVQGTNRIWYMGGDLGVSRREYKNVTPATDLNWQIESIADFDRDRIPDILWRYTGLGASQGVNLIWYMGGADGATLREWKALPAETDLNWQIAAIADHDRDGIPDILWRYYGPEKTENDPNGAPVTLAPGTNRIWYMGGDLGISRREYKNVTPVGDLNWQISGVSDHDRDGFPDIVWRYDGGGEPQGKNFIWYMSGADGATLREFKALLTEPDLNWQIASSSHYLRVTPPSPAMAATDPALASNRPGVADQPLDTFRFGGDFGASIADPVSLADGSWHFTGPGLCLGGQGMPLCAEPYYSTRNRHDGFSNFGATPGWTINYDRRLVKRDGGAVDLQLETGELFRYTDTDGDGGFASPAGNETSLVFDAVAGAYTLTSRDGIREVYDLDGRLITLADRFDNRLLFQWDEALGGEGVRRITNARTGQAIELVHHLIQTGATRTWRLTAIRDAPENGSPRRTITLTYTADQLTAIRDEAGKTHTFRYDAQGRIDQYTNPNNDAVTNTYDAATPYRVASQTLPSGTTASFAWNGAELAVTYRGKGKSRTITYTQDAPGGLNSGRVTEATIPNSTTPAMGASYDRRSWKPTQVTEPAAQRCTELGYNARGDVTSVTRNSARDATTCGGATIGTIALERDLAFGEPIMLTDALGYRTDLTWDRGALIGQTVYGTDGSRQTTTITNTATGQPDIVTLPDGSINQQGYDDRGYPAGSTYDQTGLALTDATTYDWRGFLERSVDLQGVATTYEYADNGWLQRSTLDPGGRNIVTAYTYDDVGNVRTQTVNPGGGEEEATTSFTWIPVGTAGGYAIATMTDPEGHVTKYEYNGFGQVEKEILVSQGGRTTTYAYTDEGWLDTITRNDGAVFMDYDYYPSGQLAAVTDGEGKQTSYDAYDAAGRLEQETRGSGAQRAVYRYQYNDNDQMTRIDGPNGWFVTYDYTDPYNQLKAETNAAGDRTAYTYHPTRNWLEKVIVGVNTPSESVTTSYTYDDLGRRRTMTVGEGAEVYTTTYDYTNQCSNGDTWNLQLVTDPKGIATAYCYDRQGLLSRTVDAQGRIWQYSYNKLGCLATITPPVGAPTAYTCDKLNRHETLTRNGQREQWVYHPDGTLDYFIDFAGRTTDYLYDPLGRLEHIDYPAGPASAGEPSNPAFRHSYTYFKNDLVQSVTDPHGVTSYTYDSLNLLATRTRDGETVRYQNDANGRLDAMTYWDQGVVDYGYNAANQLTSLNPWSSGAISYAYRSAGQLDTQTRPGAAPDSRYAYFRDGLLKGLDHGAAGSLSYTTPNGDRGRDNNGNITAVRDSMLREGETLDSAYSYDALNRLDTASLPSLVDGPNISFAYDYDAAGNRTKVLQNGNGPSMAYDASDRIQGATYDQNGNLLELSGPTQKERYVGDMSGDGRYHAFATSEALVEDDTNEVDDVYVWDRENDTVDRVSLGDKGEQGNAVSFAARISDDGRFVAFISAANNLAPNDPRPCLETGAYDNCTEVYIRDRDLDENGIFDEADADGVEKTSTERVFYDTPDIPIEDRPLIQYWFSVDGRYLTLWGWDEFPRRNVDGTVGSNTGFRDQLYVYDRASGTGLAAPIPFEYAITNWTESNVRSPSMSEDGRYVAFVFWEHYHTRDASGRIVSNRRQSVYLYDRQDDTLTRVEHWEYTGYSSELTVWKSFDDSVIFANQYIYYVKYEDNDAPRTSVNKHLLYDIQTGQTVDQDTVIPSEYYSYEPYAGYQETISDSRIVAMTPNGRFVLFNSINSAIVPDDANTYCDNVPSADPPATDENCQDVFVLDRDAENSGPDGIFDEPGGARVVRVSTSSSGVEGNDSSGGRAMTNDGCTAFFSSDADNLVEDDTNNASDNFSKDWCVDAYQYDTANRLVRSESGDGTIVTDYSYDGNHNLIKEVITAGGVITTTHLILDEYVAHARVIGEVRTVAEQDAATGERQTFLYAYGPDGLAAQKVTPATSGPAGGLVAAPARVSPTRADTPARDAPFPGALALGGLLALLGASLLALRRRTRLRRLRPGWAALTLLLSAVVLASAALVPVQAAPAGGAAAAAPGELALALPWLLAGLPLALIAGLGVFEARRRGMPRARWWQRWLHWVVIVCLLYSQLGSMGARPAQAAPAAATPDGVFYPLLDHKGSVRAMVNQTGTITLRQSYDPWGKVRSQDGNDAPSLGWDGERSSCQDGLTWLRARHYSPTLGRFLQRDSYAGVPTAPQSLNRYAGMEGNPVNGSDPSGHELITLGIIGTTALVVSYVGGGAYLFYGPHPLGDMNRQDFMDSLSGVLDRLFFRAAGSEASRAEARRIGKLIDQHREEQSDNRAIAQARTGSGCRPIPGPAAIKELHRDSKGRVTLIKALSLFGNSAPRDNSRKGRALHAEIRRRGYPDRDQAGHLIASSLGGVDKKWNLAPFLTSFNNGLYKGFELGALIARNQYCHVYIQVELEYRGASFRPTKVRYTYWTKLSSPFRSPPVPHPTR